MPKRPKTHQLETESLTVFRSIVPNHWPFRELGSDYGIDGEVEIFDSKNEATGKKFYIQMKSTASNDHKDCLKQTFKLSTLNYFRSLEYPVLICKYCKITGTLFYKWAQSKLDRKIRPGQLTTTIYFPDSNILTNKVMLSLEIPVTQFLNYKKDRITHPFKFSLYFTSCLVNESDFLLEMLNFSKTIHPNITISEEPKSIGSITINDDCLIVAIGGDVASGTIYHKEPQELSPSKLVNDVYSTLALILACTKNNQCAADIFKFIYKETYVLKNKENVFKVLKCLYDAQEYNFLTVVFKMLIYQNELFNSAREFAAIASAKINRSRSEEIALVENLKKLELERHKKDGDDKVTSAAYYNLGNHYMSTSQSLLAVNCFNKARKLYPTYLQRNYFCRDLGSLFYNHNKFNMALKFYKMSLENEEFEDTRARYGDTLLRLGEVELSLNELSKFSDGSNAIEYPYWQLKTLALKHIFYTYKLPSKISNKTINLEYDDHVESVDDLVKIVSEKLLCRRAWYSLGLKYAQVSKPESAMWAFLWAAFIYKMDTQAWCNSIITGFKAVHDGFDSSIITQILLVAFTTNGETLLNEMFKIIEKDPDSANKEFIKKAFIEMAATLEINERFTIRQIGADGKFQVVDI